MANSDYMKMAIDAISRLRDELGEGALFPFDRIWTYLTAAENIPSPSRPSLAKPLIAEGYLESTGRNTNAISQARAGSLTTEYRIGPRLRHVTNDSDKGTFISKPFLILAGPSGTGKSRWVRQQAYETWNPSSEERSNNSTPPNYALIPVKPNWHDSSELLGYVTRLGLNEDEQARYAVTDFIRFLAKAWSALDIPHWLCLDEMNLAPVEQYFAEYLSVIETRRLRENMIVTDPILPATSFKELNDGDWARFCDVLELEADSHLREDFRKHGIALPQNLVVVGTVNMDETTHSFSRKVLDRAFVWEMPIGDLASGWEPLRYPNAKRAWKPLRATEGSDAKEILGTLDEPWFGKSEISDAIVAWLIKANEALAGTPFQVSYRVRDELLLLAAARSVETTVELAQALDDGLCGKILPRIEGDEVRTRKALTGLYRLLLEMPAQEEIASEWSEAVSDDDIDFRKLSSLDAGPTFVFDGEDWKNDPFASARPWRRSLAKVRTMLLKLEGQFTSYWD